MPNRSKRRAKPERLKHPAEDSKRAEIAALKRVSRLTTQITRLQRQLDTAITRAQREQIEFARAVIERHGWRVAPVEHAAPDTRSLVNV